MSSLLNALVINSVAMSIVATLFFIALPILANIYSARWIYYTWLVIIIGFIIPYWPYVEIKFFNTGLLIMKQESNGLIVLENYLVNINQPFIHQVNSSIITMKLLITCIWFIGMCSVICYHVLRHYRFIELIKRWSYNVTDQQILLIFQKVMTEMRVLKKINLLVCPFITSPMMVGLFKPTILLPKDNFHENELVFILKHEITHFTQKDLWCKYLMLGIMAIYWFNPIIYLIAYAMSIQCEKSCDEEVIRHANFNTRKQYCETIIAVVSHQSKSKTMLSSHFNGGMKDMKNRILAIMGIAKKKTGVVMLCCMIIFIIGSGSVVASAMESTTIEKKIGSSTDSISESYQENDKNISQEQVKNDKKQVKGKEDEYQEYAVYGLVYDSKLDTLSYGDKTVRFFYDGGAGRSFTNYIHVNYEDYSKMVDLTAIRDANGVLTGISAASEDMFKQRTDKINSNDILRQLNKKH